MYLNLSVQSADLKRKKEVGLDRITYCWRNWSHNIINLASKYIFSLSPDATSKMDSFDPQKEERVYLCQHMFDILIFVWHLGEPVLLMGLRVQS